MYPSDDGDLYPDDGDVTVFDERTVFGKGTVFGGGLGA